MKTFKQYLEEARGFGVLDGRTNPILVVTYTNGNSVQLEVEPRIVASINEFELGNSILFNRKTKKSTHVSAIPLTDIESKKTYYAVAFHNSQSEAEGYTTGYQPSNLKKKLADSETNLKGDIKSVDWSTTSSVASVPQLKPKLFFVGKETWKTLETYVADLKKGIADLEIDAIDDIHKQIMQNLVDDPDKGCLRGTGLSKMSQVPNGEKFVQKLNNDFGECIGPIKILTDPDFMPWIKGVSEIFVPDKSNYAFMDYSITDKEGIEHRISAKTAKGLGNTVKIQDILQTIEDTLKSKSRTIMYKLFMFNGSKYGEEWDLLQKIFELRKEKSILNILKTAQLLIDKYGDKEDRDFLSAYASKPESFYNSLSSKSELGKMPLESKKYPTVKSLLSASNTLIKKYSSKPTIINKAITLMINLAFQDKVYFAKFAVKDNGETIWEVRGRKSDYSNIYVGNKKRFGTSRYSTIYLDPKGARGNEKVGLRIESVDDFYDILDTLFG